MSRFYLSCYLILCWLMVSCSGTNLDRSLILEHAADSLIIPAYQNFETQSDSLHLAITTFTETPNATTLELAKNSWRGTIKSWKRAEVYNFGPVEQQFLVSEIDRWPTSEAGIEDAISSYDGSEDYLIRVGSNRKGLPAIEYLLFHDEPEIVINEFNSENRKVYLKLLSITLSNYSSTILQAWENGYRQEFVKDDGNTAMSGITLLANEMGYLLEMIKTDKIDIPSGSQTMGTPRLQLLESPFSEASKELIRENLETVQRTFNGNESSGFDDYLKALNIEGENGALLSEVINHEFEQAYINLDNIQGSLKNAIQNEPQKVKDLSETVQRLFILVDVDMISQLGILSVYSDNDGD